MGSAATSPALLIPFTIGASQIVGQGNFPIVRARYSTDNFSEPTPTWIELTYDRLRNFSISRGRESELQAFDAGTATITLDNRDRRFDPTVALSLIRPMNRWWIYAEFSSEIHTLFYGYAESYDQQWPGWGGSDAECVVSLVDEFKVLALSQLPSTNPPRDSYNSLVESDNPVAYWRLNEDPEIRVQEPEDVEVNPLLEEWPTVEQSWSFVDHSWRFRGRGRF